MDNFSQISLGFVEETATDSTTPPAAREDQPVNIGVRIKKLKLVDSEGSADSKVKEPVPDALVSKQIIPAEAAITAAPAAAEPVTVSAETFDVPLEVTTATGSADPVSVGKIKSGRGRKSIRQIAEEADLIRIPEDEVLFLKQYYTMGEVAEMFRVNQSLLRFWEAEFDILQPKKNKKGDRYFRPADIKNLHLIYHLLRQRKYTIEGAKDFLKKGKKAEEKFEAIKKLEQIRDFLLEMKASIR